MSNFGESLTCPLLPATNRFEPVDEYIDDQQCYERSEHSDHYWSVERHKHEDIGFVCQRYCFGVDKPERPNHCTICGVDGPDRVDVDDEGGVEMACGDEWHDGVFCIGVCHG